MSRATAKMPSSALCESMCVRKEPRLRPCRRREQDRRLFGGLVVAERVPGGRLAGAFGWFVIVLALVIGGLVAAGVRITALT